MNIVDKYGAYWHRSDYEGDLIFEFYDDKLDLIGAVHKKPAGLYVACLYEKVEDPMFDSPSWSEIKPDALFDNLDEAKAHITAQIANRP